MRPLSVDGAHGVAHCSGGAHSSGGAPAQRTVNGGRVSGIVRVGSSVRHGRQPDHDAASAYPTAQQVPVTASPPDPDTLARPIAAGCREVGALIGVPAGGSTEGPDLAQLACRVLHALPVQYGLRAAGMLTTSVPAGQLLPALHTKPPPYPGDGGLQFPGLRVARVAAVCASALAAAVALHDAASGHLRRQGSGVFWQPLRKRDSGSKQPFRTSYISVFGRVLGAYSPYRGLSLPPDLTRFECKAAVHHFGNDCPIRFARVRGETRPGGWPIDGPGGVSKNQAGLLGAYSLYRGLSLSPI